MVKICLGPRFKHIQIEFPDSTPHPEGRRGGRGTSLHLRAGVYRDVTEEELAYIKILRPQVFASLKIQRPAPVSRRTLRKLKNAADAKAAAKKAAAPPAKAKRSKAK